jgi:DNA-binding FadR family transcriptional regulator
MTLPSERVLAEEHGLSRSMVRESLRTLAERRLIEIRPGRGSIVRGPSIEGSAERLTGIFDERQITARALIEARTMVEATAAGLAASQCRDVALGPIDEALAGLDRGASLADQVRGDFAFHLAVVRGAGNPLIETMFIAIRPYTLELMIRSLTDDRLSSESLPYHQRIRDGIASGDADAASGAMREHLATGLRYYGDDLDRSLDVVTRRSLGLTGDAGLSLETLLGPGF